jgi:hypothetical protein
VRAPAIPLGDTSGLARVARRTTILRLALLVAIALVAGACVVSGGRLDVAQATVLGPGTNGVVVLDLSSSTESAPPREIPGLLRHLANAGGHTGLVLFSDVSYEALPLGASSEELRPFLRYFRRPPGPAVPERRGATPPPPRPLTPWSRSFRSGTRISAGLADARRMVLADTSRRHDVILVSDLNDSLFDIEALERELRVYRHDDIRLRIVPLRPSTEARGFFASRLGRAAFVQRSTYADGLTGQTVRPVRGSTPTLLIVLVSLLAVALAANEVLCGRLAWRPA